MALVAAEDGLVADDGGSDPTILARSGARDHGDLGERALGICLAPGAEPPELQFLRVEREAVDGFEERSLGRRERQVQQRRVSDEVHNGGRRHVRADVFARPSSPRLAQPNRSTGIGSIVLGAAGSRVARSPSWPGGIIIEPIGDILRPNETLRVIHLRGILMMRGGPKGHARLSCLRSTGAVRYGGGGSPHRLSRAAAYRTMSAPTARRYAPPNGMKKNRSASWKAAVSPSEGSVQASVSHPKGYRSPSETHRLKAVLVRGENPILARIASRMIVTNPRPWLWRWKVCTRARERSRSEEHTSELQSLRHLVCR